MPDLTELGKKVVRDADTLVGARANMDAIWTDVTTYTRPLREFNTRQTTPLERVRKIYDPTGVNAAGLLAGFIHAFLTNPSQIWFAPHIADSKVNQEPVVQEWLRELRRGIFAEFARGKVNFHPAFHELYLDLVTLCTAVMFQSDDNENDRLSFRTIPLGQMYLREAENSLVDAAVRQFHMPLRQIIKKFGETAVPTNLVSKVKTDPEATEEVIHWVGPREDRILDIPLSQNKPIASVYVLRNGAHVLRNGGFDDFPYLTPRWSKMAGFVYGTGPGIETLPSVQMLQAMMRTVIKGSQKIVDPPLQVPDDGFMRPPVTIPGGLNYYRAGTRDKIEPIETGGRPDLGLGIIQAIQTQVRQGFFVDLLLSREGPQMTATEVIERRDEVLRLLAPVIARLQTELLDPLIERTIKLMLKAGRLPEPPDILAGQTLEIEYTSPAAMSQKLAESENVIRWLSQASAFMQLDESSAQVVNADEGVRMLAELYDTPVRLIRSREDLGAIREQIAQATAQQRQLEDAQTAASAAEKGGKAAKAFAESGVELPGAGGEEELVEA
jgi:hypothetical protein